MMALVMLVDRQRRSRFCRAPSRGGRRASAGPRPGRGVATGWGFLAILLAVIVAGGCERSADATGAGETILRVANWGGAAVDSDFMKLERQIIREFEQRHPGVRVRVEQIPGAGQYAPKLLMMHVAGSVPDVIQLDASSAAVFIDNGVLRDLMPYVRRDQRAGMFHLDDYFANVTAIARRGAALYAIPLDFTPMVIYYNKRLFDAAGVPYPHTGWSWDAFLDTARRLTIPADQPGRPPRQYGINFENNMPLWVLWLWTNGGDVLSPDGTRAGGYFDGPKSIEAVQFIVDLIEKYHVAPHLRESMAAGVDLFRAQRAAMDLKGHWMMLDYRADGLDVGVVELPTRGVPPVTVVYASGLAITAKARHPRLAWEYIKYLTSEGVQVRRVGSGLAISGNRKAAAHFAADPIERAFLAAVRHARPPWGARVERYPFLEDLGREMMEDILYSDGRLSVERAMHQTARLMDAALRE